MDAEFLFQKALHQSLHLPIGPRSVSPRTWGVEGSSPYSLSVEDDTRSLFAMHLLAMLVVSLGGLRRSSAHPRDHGIPPSSEGHTVVLPEPPYCGGK
jgi:hypothetical protein